MLRCMKTNSYSVLELCEIFSTKQPAMSHHLKVLQQAGLITSRREGTAIYYRRASGLPQGGAPLAAVEQLVPALLASIDLLPLSEELQERLDAIRQHRSRVAREFFNRRSAEFTDDQDCIALPSQYLGIVEELLPKQSPVAATAVDLGVGTGEILPVLSAAFDTVYGIDIAEAMIETSRALIATEGLSNVHLATSDISSLSEGLLPTGIPPVTHIICNMVLHHVSSPSDVFIQCARFLRARGIGKGFLIVSELCRHTQSWVLEKCGDLWMGFEPEELLQCATHAGFRGGESHYIGLRNGFQVQVHRFDITTDSHALRGLAQ
jgi:2-polyprenyl-3-methyl-5-hydroxy-6-metoxy-1,4-benzoquinol methylase